MAVLVDVIRVAFEARKVVMAHRLAEVDHTLRIPKMSLALLAKAILASG